jgi:hypothetical protein
MLVVQMLVACSMAGIADLHIMDFKATFLQKKTSSFQLQIVQTLGTFNMFKDLEKAIFKALN